MIGTIERPQTEQVADYVVALAQRWELETGLAAAGAYRVQLGGDEALDIHLHSALVVRMVQQGWTVEYLGAGAPAL